MAKYVLVILSSFNKPEEGEDIFSASSVTSSFIDLRKHLMNGCFCQIIALNKTKERMRPYQGNQEDEDPDIKKIKKVSTQSPVLERKRVE